MTRLGMQNRGKVAQLLSASLPLLVVITLSNGNLNHAQSFSSTSPPSTTIQQEQQQQLAATSNSQATASNLQASQNVASPSVNQAGGNNNNKSASSISTPNVGPQMPSLQQQPQPQLATPVKAPANLATISGQAEQGGQFASMQNKHAHHNYQHQHSMQQQQQIQLPNITIYISRNEIRKLLGIDTEIYYIQQGHVKPYPLAFAIPLGYNQSDIIFTWQNMGQASVNYSISLSIGNVEAVETPLINITRSGMMPRQEQVFKITLPCSGKLSAEVDVQVLIQLSCLQADSAASGEQAAHADNSLGGQEQAAATFRTFSHTLAVRRKKICTQQPAIAPAPPSAASSAAGMSPMVQQARQAATLPATQATNKQFARPQANSNSGPAQIQNSANQANGAAGPPIPRFLGGRSGAGSSSSSPTYQDQDQNQDPPSAAASPNLNLNLNQAHQVARFASSLDEPAYQQQQQQSRLSATKDISSPIFGPSSASELNEPPANLVRSGSHPMPPVAPIPLDNPLSKWVKPPMQNAAEQLQPQSPAATATTNGQLATSSSVLVIATCLFLISALIVILLLASSSQSSSSATGGASGIAVGFSRQSSLKKYPLNSIGKLASIKSWLTRRNSHSASSSSRSSSSSTSTGHHGHQQGGLGSFGATFGIISAGTLRDAQHNHHNHQHLHQQHSMRLNKSSNVLFGSGGGAGFNLGHSTNKLSESGLAGSGNSTTLIRGLNHNANVHPTKQQQHSGTSDNNGNQTSFHCSYYGTNSIYSHPPTADLLGTGYQASSNNIANYQQQQQHQAPTSFHQPGNMYHPVTTSNHGLTTRLVWQQANERQQQQQQLSPHEAGYFMAHSQTGRSETGSLYQTID